MTPHVTPNNILVVEVSIRNPEAERRLEQSKNNNHSLSQFGQYLDPFYDYTSFLSGSDFQSRIVDKVSVKNNALIVQGEHKYKDENRSERSFFFRSTTLPPGTQVGQLKSQLMDDGQLKIQAPFIEQKENVKPIENLKK